MAKNHTTTTTTTMSSVNSLQEVFQAQGLGDLKDAAEIAYEENADKTFTCTIASSGLPERVQGVGSTKKQAKKAACDSALSVLGMQNFTTTNNKRKAFIGDSLFRAMMAIRLSERFQSATHGQLSAWIATLQSKEVMATALSSENAALSSHSAATEFEARLCDAFYTTCDQSLDALFTSFCPTIDSMIDSCI